MGFSQYWYADGTSLLVYLPYFTVTVIGSEGNFCPLYFSVLQVITTPNDRLKQRENVYHPLAAEASRKGKGRGLHFTGNSTHSDGDVLLGGGVQIFSFDGDDCTAGCWTLGWHDSHWFGVLTEIINESLVTGMEGRGQCGALTMAGNYDHSCDNYQHPKEQLLSFILQDVGCSSSV